ncbi:MAG TPA: ABC transporter permease [Brevundimonas sp.]|uniref:ABC transporter permease n=1 Tax=Brevundimonas sp. TaxID=1871086 RepID=UPI002BF2C15D|nr:ABC transporter permease [Brevundimonas sp.]HRH19694.1 ABC transporter permease [Brevundimonas sp.]
MSLALSTLIYEWRRYMAAVVALAFSGLLVLAFAGMFMGMGKSFTATIDRSGADILVLAPGATQLFGGPSGLPRRMIPVIYQHPEVEVVDYVDLSQGRFQSLTQAQQNRPGQGAQAGGERMEFVMVTSVVTQEGNPTIPVDYSPELIEALRQPDAVVLDETALPRLGVQLGDQAIYNGHTVRVVGVTRGYANFMQPGMVMSRDTLRRFGETYNGPRVGPLMVRLRDPSRAELVVAQLNATANGQYRAWTRAELSKANEASMFEEGIIVVMLGFSVFLGGLIGIAITWQTLRGAILANIKEFASLRALGVGMGSLRRIIVELSFWVGVVGIGASFLLTWLISLLAGAFGLPMAFPLPMCIAVASLLMVIAILSGFLSLGMLKQSQPADLLR